MTMITLAPFEAHVMDAIRYYVEQHEQIHGNGPIDFDSDAIRFVGQMIVSPTWAGPRRVNYLGVPTYPTINAAFGRLQNKGLLQRNEYKLARTMKRSWGFWQLTPMGRDVLGLMPISVQV